MLVVANTDLQWFNLLRQLPPIEVINFWRPGSQPFRALDEGELFYFMLKSPIKKIGGYGTFKQFTFMTIRDAWDTFGVGNGVISLSEFRERLQSFEKTVPGAGQAEREIGCIQLTNCVFLDDTEYKSAAELEIEFPNNIVSYKTFSDLDLLQI